MSAIDPSWIWSDISTSTARDHQILLHLSKEEQRRRFLDRIDDPEKNWKFWAADIEERKYWKEYMKAYEKCLSATSTNHAPWYVVPADDKLNTRLIVSRIVLDTIEALQLATPRAALRGAANCKRCANSW